MSAGRVGQPLLADWTAPHGLPPFGAIEPAHFEPALMQAMQEHRDEVAALGAQAGPADFDNTCAAFDRAGRRFGQGWQHPLVNKACEGLRAVLRIRIRTRIRMFLGLLDPDPDPSIIMQKQ